MCTTLNPMELTTDAASHKLQQKTFFKRMGTPDSLISTAPNSPAANWKLEDDHDDDGIDFGDLECHSEDKWESTLPAVQEHVEVMDSKAYDPRMCVGMPPLSSNLGKWAQWAVEWETMNGELRNLCGDDAEASSEGDPEEDDDTPWETTLDMKSDAHVDEMLKEEPRICIGMPPLSSNLGQACQWLVNFEMYNGSVDEMPALSSDLGLWASNVVEDDNDA